MVSDLQQILSCLQVLQVFLCLDYKIFISKFIFFFWVKRTIYQQEVDSAVYNLII